MTTYAVETGAVECCICERPEGEGDGWYYWSESGAGPFFCSECEELADNARSEDWWLVRLGLAIQRFIASEAASREATHACG